jgi:hypothetical protein
VQELQLVLVQRLEQRLVLVQPLVPVLQQAQPLELQQAQQLVRLVRRPEQQRQLLFQQRPRRRQPERSHLPEPKSAR